jgi:hypothetical protein
MNLGLNEKTRSRGKLSAGFHFLYNTLSLY